MIVCLLIAGMSMVLLPNSPLKFNVYRLHKSFGITVLALVLFRLWWKMRRKAPALPASLAPYERRLAYGGHALLYVLMLGLPLSGWLMSSAAGFGVSFFGLFNLPDLVEPERGLKSDMMELHETLAWVMILMLCLHVAAALMHHFVHKNDVLKRMLPFAKNR